MVKGVMGVAKRGTWVWAERHDPPEASECYLKRAWTWSKTVWRQSEEAPGSL